MECPICLDSIQEEFSSPCGHTMCSSCYAKWRDEQVQKCSSVTCPTCRFVIIEVATIKIDIFAPPAGYNEDNYINSPRPHGLIPFPSMDEEEYNEALDDLVHEEHEEENWEDEDWDGKDDWEYEDVDNYLVATAY